jgi:hypothetical protein
MRRRRLFADVVTALIVAMVVVASVGVTLEGRNSASAQSEESDSFFADSALFTETTTPQVAFRSSSSASSQGTLVTNLVIPKPANIVVGDLMWMHLTVIRPQPLSNVPVGDPVVPSGWILIKEIDAVNAVRTYLYRKIAATEPATGYSVGLGVPSQVAAGIGVYSGANPYLFATAEATAIEAKAVTVPGVFGWPGGVVAEFFGALGAPVTRPGGTSQRWYAVTTQASTSLRTASLGADEAVSGPISARSATSTSRLTWTALLISMHPS